jgi:hypothetical protein
MSVAVCTAKGELMDYNHILAMDYPRGVNLGRPYPDTTIPLV